MPRARTPFARRLHVLRMAIRYSRSRFAHVLGVSAATLESVGKGAYPSMYMVRRLKLMERAFKEPLARYLSDPVKYGGWGKEVKVYGKYEGDLYVRRMVMFRSSILLPLRKADIEALGGMAVFGRSKTKAKCDDKRRFNRVGGRKDAASASGEGEEAGGERGGVGKDEEI